MAQAHNEQKITLEKQRQENEFVAQLLAAARSNRIDHQVACDFLIKQMEEEQDQEGYEAKREALERLLLEQITAGQETDLVCGQHHDENPHKDTDLFIESNSFEVNMLHNLFKIFANAAIHANVRQNFVATTSHNNTKVRFHFGDDKPHEHLHNFLTFVHSVKYGLPLAPHFDHSACAPFIGKPVIDLTSLCKTLRALVHPEQKNQHTYSTPKPSDKFYGK